MINRDDNKPLIAAPLPNLEEFHDAEMDESDLELFVDEEEQLRRDQEERDRRMKEIQLKHQASKQQLANTTNLPE